MINIFKDIQLNSKVIQMTISNIIKRKKTTRLTKFILTKYISITQLRNNW